jgi:hypothetical protein
MMVSTVKSKSQSTLLSLSSCAAQIKSITSFTNWKELSLDLSWKFAVFGDTVKAKPIFSRSSLTMKNPEKLASLQPMGKRKNDKMSSNGSQKKTPSYVQNAVDITITTVTFKSI